MARDWPLTGRAEELDLVGVACGRSGAGIVIAGRAGVGKTRLATAGAERASKRGMRVRTVVGTATGQGIPLGAFSSYVVVGAGDIEERIAATRAALLDGGSAADTVVVVDDAHLLDVQSATLVCELVVSRAAKVIATVRTGEPAPDAVSALWRSAGLPRIEVQALSRTESTVLVESVLGGQLDRAAADRLFELSAGNVLYLRQMVDGELDTRRLVEEHSVWRWVGAPTLSPTLSELVAERIGDQPRRVRDVLEILALAEPLPRSVLADVIPMASVEDAESRGLVTVERAGSDLLVRTAHPLYAEASRATLGTLRARRLRADLVFALATRSDHGGAATMRRADLMLDADMAPDAELLTQAAEVASTLSDSRLVERFARAAVDAGGGFRAQKVLAFFVAWTSTDADAADLELARLEALAETDDQRARAVAHRAIYLAFVAMRPDAADEVLRGAEDLARRMPLVAGAAAMLAVERLSEGAVERGERVMADSRAGDEAVAVAGMALATAYAGAGRVADLEGVVSRAVPAAWRSGEFASYAISVAATYVHALGIAGLTERARTVATEWDDQLRPGREPASLFADCMVGDAALGAGQLTEAVRFFREARSGLERFGDMGGWRYVALIMLTRTLALTGDTSGAQTARDDMERHRHLTFTAFEPERLITQSTVAAAEGALTRAQTIALEAADLAERGGQWAYAVLALQQAICLGVTGVAERCATLRDRVEGPRAAIVSAFARAADASDGAALLAVSREFEGIGDLVTATDAAAMAAEAFDRAGLTGSALGARATTDLLSNRGGGIRTPAVTRAACPLPLTTREREIATLAARGLTNQAIAGILVVSVRTVEGHLYRVNQKLGTTNRDELTRILG